MRNTSPSGCAAVGAVVLVALFIAAVVIGYGLRIGLGL